MKKALGLILIISLLILTGCRNNELASKYEVIKYVRDKFKVKSEVVSLDERNAYEGKCITYHMIDKYSGFQFDCEARLARDEFGTYSIITDNYDSKKYEMNKDEINKILLANNITFDELDFGEEKYSSVNINADDVENLDLDSYVEPVSQLINLLDYRGMDMLLLKIRINGESTYKYFLYNYETKTNEIHDLEKEINQFYNIPENLINDFNEYFNEKYSGDIKITSANLFFSLYGVYGDGDAKTLQGRIREYHLLDGNYIKFRLKYNTFMPENIEFEQSGSTENIVIIKIDVDEYRNDLNNNSLKDLKYYIKK